ncbi:MAG: hypothetical protein AB8B77_02570 [Alphaproteobacteria bacterium]
MYEDHSLQPSEAVKLLALGLLMEGYGNYGEIAQEIRQFTTKIVGPSLDLLGSSLEILKLEGLADISGDKSVDAAARHITITDQGKSLFKALMGSDLRVPLNDVNRLVLLIKLRFMPYLDQEMLLDQLDLYRELIQKEMAWGRALSNKNQAGNQGSKFLQNWLQLEQDSWQAKLTYIESLCD